MSTAAAHRFRRGDLKTRHNGQEGPRLQQVFQGRASTTGRSVAQEEAAALANQSIKRFVDPADIAALAVFLASDAARSISGQMIPIDGDSQSAS